MGNVCLELDVLENLIKDNMVQLHFRLSSLLVMYKLITGCHLLATIAGEVMGVRVTEHDINVQFESPEWQICVDRMLWGAVGRGVEFHQHLRCARYNAGKIVFET